MLRNVRDALALPRGKTVAVAVSGGADSVALLDVMLKLSDEYGVSIIAAHFNHNLRGKESDRDMQFVKDLCERLGVRLICGEGDVKAFAKEQKLSTELAARQLRYEFFDKLPADFVATAHTASDNLETVIFNLTRGCGLGGLCGIPQRRGKYIRPLIFCTRDDVEKYCKDNNLEFVTDSTNLSDDYTRNRIRHKIVPLLKEINPAVENNVINTSVSLSFDRETLNGIAKKEYQKRLKDTGLDVKDIASLGGATAGRVLRFFCAEKTGITPDYKHSEHLFSVAVNGGRCSLEGGAAAYRQKGILKIESPDSKVGYKVTLKRQNADLIKKGKKINNLLLNSLLDCDKIVGDPIVRTRCEGDKIRLAGRGCTKTLKQLYNENAVPQEQRKNLPVIADDNGVIWVCGIGVAERVRVSDNTCSVYKISYETVYGGNNTK